MSEHTCTTFEEISPSCLLRLNFFGLPYWLSSKESTCNAGNMGSVTGSGRSPGGGHGNPLQYSCLENLMDRASWWATIHGVTKSQTCLKQLSMHAVDIWIFKGCGPCPQNSFRCMFYELNVISFIMWRMLQSCNASYKQVSAGNIFPRKLV